MEYESPFEWISKIFLDFKKKMDKSIVLTFLANLSLIPELDKVFLFLFIIPICHNPTL